MRTRLLDPELLDAPEQDLDELSESLVMVAQVNRWLGGVASVQRHLDTYRGRACRILDIGTGNGDTAVELLRSLGARKWTVTGVDISPLTAGLARNRHPDQGFVAADALRLPFAEGSYDVVVSFLTLHHFDDTSATAIVREMARVSRGQVLISDLERTRLNYMGAKFMASTLWRRNRLTRNDGPLSVLKSFRAEEMMTIAEASGLPEARVTRHFFYRLVLSGRGVQG
jgi:ubiquinone/menaquinone biosynthesis C-methylase UbiE